MEQHTYIRRSLNSNGELLIRDNEMEEEREVIFEGKNRMRSSSTWVRRTLTCRVQCLLEERRLILISISLNWSKWLRATTWKVESQSKSFHRIMRGAPLNEFGRVGVRRGEFSTTLILVVTSARHLRKTSTSQINERVDICCRKEETSQTWNLADLRVSPRREWIRAPKGRFLHRWEDPRT